MLVIFINFHVTYFSIFYSALCLPTSNNLCEGRRDKYIQQELLRGERMDTVRQVLTGDFHFFGFYFLFPFIFFHIKWFISNIFCLFVHLSSFFYNYWCFFFSNYFYFFRWLGNSKRIPFKSAFKKRPTEKHGNGRIFVCNKTVSRICLLWREQGMFFGGSGKNVPWVIR